MGCLLLGRKDSHASYSIRDFQLLRTLSPFAGLAIMNLELHYDLVERECRAVAADLAGGISHEINNALYPLKGQAQLIQYMLQNQEELSNQDQFVSSAKLIAEMSDRIQRISDNLNRLSKPIRPNKQIISLNDIAEKAIEILSETAGRIKRFKTDQSKAPFKLRLDFAVDLPQIKADPLQISQVYINLILNAADAMETLDQGVLTVGTRRSADNKMICGFVEDTGVGIPQENIKEITLPYYTTKSEGKGTGLGLAIAKSIIDNHSGSLSIRSILGEGTQVEFSLPADT
jgi:signal transduction histidine kinase